MDTQTIPNDNRDIERYLRDHGCTLGDGESKHDLLFEAYQ